jgi:hypothetical protein
MPHSLSLSPSSYYIVLARPNAKAQVRSRKVGRDVYWHAAEEDSSSEGVVRAGEDFLFFLFLDRLLAVLVIVILHVPHVCVCVLILCKSAEGVV